jgi:hypothetical protein
VQNNNQYYFDLMGYGPAVTRYYQTYASAGCTLSLFQNMSIYGVGTQTFAYASHPVTVSLTSSSVAVARGSAFSGVLSYPTQ